MSGIFKAYDIRGVYPEQLDENIAERIGRAVVVFLKAKKIVVGRDMRPHSLPLFEALAKGIEEVCFDRGGFLYHGRISALADAAREAGLNF